MIASALSNLSLAYLMLTLAVVTVVLILEEPPKQ